jgi:CheY-like chemotaxis protein
MARVLISEPNPLVQRMLVRMVERVGHEPAVARAPGAGELIAPQELGSGGALVVELAMELASAEVLLVELASAWGLTLAQAARTANPSLPIVCASVTAPPAELGELGIELAGRLVKPFTSEELQRALRDALTGSRRPGGASFEGRDSRGATIDDPGGQAEGGRAASGRGPPPPTRSLSPSPSLPLPLPPCGR